jgi:hypothetical protein
MKKEFDWDTVGLDFGNWSDEKLWALEEPVAEIEVEELIWHFDVPFWENDEGVRWTVSPWDVIKKAPGSQKELARVAAASLEYPIDLLFNKDKWLVLDGLHRLVKAYLSGQAKVNCRKIPRDRLPDILIDEPIEMPK